MSTYQQQHYLYQCDPHMAQALKSHKEKAYESLKTAVNRKVRVHTAENQSLEGTIVGVDMKFLYICVETDLRGFYPGYFPPSYGYPYPPFNPYYNRILPLALFDLLAVGLLF